ncbi:hypothetical protein ACFQ3R_07920 [Mesonia ostreae]|uniref:Uncharacterized protein n=1 Tax=Mesonia ostreae TaxID=861110 RepID=A0ABU2KFC7_9FLAO|nr:hypothetical protein [Mesonia ostreae]MDT0293403.1 hypothetical protein [Mesonia ostreae]
MTLRLFISLVFLFNCIYCFAQEKTLEEKSFIDPERKGHLFLQAGPEYRITPLPYGAPLDEGFQFTTIVLMTKMMVLLLIIL